MPSTALGSGGALLPRCASATACSRPGLPAAHVPLVLATSRPRRQSVIAVRALGCGQPAPCVPRAAATPAQQSRLARSAISATPQPRSAPGQQAQGVVSSCTQQLLRTRRRQLVVAAAGRRRRSSAPEPDDDADEQLGQPQVDEDDVMYPGSEDEAGELELGDDEDGETPEAPEFESDDEDGDWADDEAEGEGDAAAAAAAGGGDADGWDAALANFDTAQDAAAGSLAAAGGEAVGEGEQDALLSEEQQEDLQLLKMVRFEPSNSRSELTVEDVPDLGPQRPKTFEEQMEALSEADRDALTANRASYTVFELEQHDLLVASTPDGRLIMSDCFVLEHFTELFSRVEVPEGTPSEPRLFQVLPWEETHMGDMLKHIDPVTQLVKVYFIPLTSSEPHDVATEGTCFSFDVRGRVFRAWDIQPLTDNIQEPVLRIREDGVFVEEAELLPGTAFVAEGFAGHPTEQYLNPDKDFTPEEYVKMGWWPGPRIAASSAAAAAAAAEDSAESQALIEERLEDLELMEELDDMPDVPAVDMV